MIGGESAVWVLLNGPADEKNRAAKEALTQALTDAETSLTLPEILPSDLEEEGLKIAPESVRIAFSVVELSRSDAEELALVEMLLASEPDLRDEQFASEPLAFPVFGRGRVLYALIGKGINPAVIQRACSFLVGACQCSGQGAESRVDLLVNIDWQSAIMVSEPEEFGPSELVGLAGFAEATEPMTILRRPPNRMHRLQRPRR